MWEKAVNSLSYNIDRFATLPCNDKGEFMKRSFEEWMKFLDYTSETNFTGELFNDWKEEREKYLNSGNVANTMLYEVAKHRRL